MRNIKIWFTSMLSISIFMILSEHFWETRGEAKTAEIRIAFKTFIFLLFFLSRSIKNLLSFVQRKSYFPLFKYIYLNNWWNYGQLLFYRGTEGARELLKADWEWWNYLRIRKTWIFPWGFIWTEKILKNDFTYIH